MLRKLFKRRDPRKPEGPRKRPPTPASAEVRPADAPVAEAAAEAAPQILAIDDVDQLIALALKTRGKQRDIVLAHPLFRQAAALTALEKRSRDKDKSLNRHARTLLDRHKALLREAQANRARAEELALALARSHSVAEDRAGRDRQLQLHQRLAAAVDSYQAVRLELAAYGDAPPDLEGLRPDAAALGRLMEVDNRALGRAPAEVGSVEVEDRPLERAPTASAAHTAPAIDGDAAGPDPFEPLVAELHALDETLTAAGQPFAALAAARQALTERWLTAADHRPPQPAQHEVFETVSQRFRQLADAVERLTGASLPALPPAPLSLPATADDGPPAWDEVEQRRRLANQLERLSRNVRWPEWAPPTAEYAAVVGSLAQLRDELARADKLMHAHAQRLDGDLTALAEAIDAGSLNAARQLLTQARARHDALPPAATRELGKRLNQQAARLAELRDWQTFATAPKREALLQAMTVLAETPLAPPDQANRIKQLRSEWQALGPVTQAADGRLADQFNAAAASAFETCRPWLAEQAEARKTNLAERRNICEQLEHYLRDADWQHVDVRAAEQIMRTAREAWRSYTPVDRARGRNVEQRFEALQAQLHERIRAEWDRNLKAKEAIVAEAQGLLQADLPLEAKTSAAKNLQARWRAIGATPRHPDQRLWLAFREACDQIFTVREQARHEADTATAAAEARCRSLLDEFEVTLAGLDPLEASDAQLREFRVAAVGIDDLPQNRRRDLAARRTGLINRYRGLLETKAEAAYREQFQELKRWDEAMTLAESGAGTEPGAGAIAAAVREARRASAAETMPIDALRRLTVRAELIAGLESPAEDESLRLEVQVERLQAGLKGQGVDEEPRALAEQWCRLGPKNAEVAPLRERFFAALLGP
jgi:DNA repair protein SbcC/Rad50